MTVQYPEDAAGADLTTLETRLTAARAGYLDNIDASLKELFYEHFASMVDDLPDVAASGTVGTPANLIDNDTATLSQYNNVNDYLELDMGHLCYIKRFRYYGATESNSGSRYKIQAYLAGTWTDVLTGIVDVDADAWSSWLDLTTPSAAIRWRVVCTTEVSTACMNEVEFDGVAVG